MAKWRYWLALLLSAVPKAVEADEVAGLSANGQWVMTGDQAGRLSVRSIETGAEVDHVDLPLIAWKALSASPDMGQVAAVGLDRQGHLQVAVWNRGAASIHIFDAPFADRKESFVVAPVIPQGGTTLLLRRSSREPGYLVDAADGRILATIGRAGPSPFSPDGKYLLSEADGGQGLRLHDAGTGAEQKILETPMAVEESRFLDDGTIVVASDHCEILRRGMADGGAWTPIRAAEEDCEFSGFSEDGRHAILEISTGIGSGQIVILSLASGAARYAAASKHSFAAVDVNVSDGILLSDVDGRPQLRPLDGGPAIDLPVSFADFDNVYRSRLVARGRLLTVARGEPRRIFDLRSGAELLCIDERAACDTGRLHADYDLTARRGRPADIVQFLTRPDLTEKALGSDWGRSRTVLADAYLALGRRADARSTLEAAIAMPALADSARARLALAPVVNGDGEPVRALRLVESLAAELERAGASAGTTRLTLVRRYNGLRIGLGPADLAELGPSLGGAGGANAAAGEIVEIDETQYSDLVERLGVTGPKELETIGFAPDLRITDHRMSLLRLAGEAEAIRASLLLERSRGKAAIDDPIAALAALDRFATLEGKVLPLAARVGRWNLRADILRRLGDVEGAIGARQLALNALEKSETPAPARIAEISRAIAEDRLALGATADAADDLARAKAALRGRVPDDALILLTTIGLEASVGLARQDGTAALEQDVERAIAAGRQRLASQRAPDGAAEYLKLAGLFEAGIDISWARSRLPSLRSAKAAAAAAGPLLTGPRPSGSILNLHYSDDGTKLMSREYSREIVWDVERAAAASARKTAYGDTPHGFDSDRPIAFADGRRAARIEGDTVLIEDGDSGVLRKILFGGLIKAAALSPDDSKLAVSGADRKLRVYATGSGTVLQELAGHSGTVVSLAWSPDSRFLASGSDAGAIIIFAAETGVMATRLSGDASAQAHKAKIGAFAFSPDSQSLFTLSNAIFERDGKPLRQWNAATRRLIAPYPADQDSAVMVSPDGRHVAAVGSQDIDIFLTAYPDVVERSAKLPEGSRFRDATIATARGAGVVSGLFNGGGTAAFDIASGKLLWRQDKADGVLLAADANGARIAVADIRGDATLWLLSGDDGHVLCSVAVKPLSMTADEGVSPFGALAFSADGSEVIGLGMRFETGSNGEPVIANLARATHWRAQDCTVTADAGGAAAGQDRAAQQAAFGGDVMAVAAAVGTPDDPVHAARFTPDGRRSYALTKQNRLWLYFAGADRAPAHLATFAAGVSQIAFSPDGARLAVASENGLWLWNAATGDLEGEAGRE